MKKMVLLLALVLILASAMVPAALAEGGEGTAAIDLTGLMNAVIAVLGALVTYRLIPWIKARTSESQQGALAACTKTLVYAAEQLYRTGAVQDKLSYVEGELERRGYTVDRDAIEAAVTQLRAETGACLAENLEVEAVSSEQADSGSVDAAATPAAATVQADDAGEGAGQGGAPGGQGAAGAEAGGEAGGEDGEESEEDA